MTRHYDFVIGKNGPQSRAPMDPRRDFAGR